MHAVEFRARLREGIIEVPADVRRHLPEVVRVILLADDTAEQDLIKELIEHPVRAEGFRPLSREEVYGDRVP